MSFGVIRRSPMIIVAFGVFLVIIGGSFIGAGFIAGTDTKTYHQQVATYNKAVAAYESGDDPDSDDINGRKARIKQKRLSVDAATTSSSGVSQMDAKEKATSEETPLEESSSVGESAAFFTMGGASAMNSRGLLAGKQRKARAARAAFRAMESAAAGPSSSSSVSSRLVGPVAGSTDDKNKGEEGYVSTVPTRRMMPELIPFTVNKAGPAVTNTSLSPLIIYGESEGAAYPFSSTIIEAAMRFVAFPEDDSKDDEGNPMGNTSIAIVSFDFSPSAAPALFALSDADVAMGIDEIEVRNFTRKVLLKKFASSPARCVDVSACDIAYFTRYCRNMYGDKAEYGGSGCSRNQQSCGECIFEGYLRSYCVPMAFSIVRGPSAANASVTVTKRVWAPDTESKSCTYPFGEHDHAYGRRQDDDTPTPQPETTTTVTAATTTTAAPITTTEEEVTSSTTTTEEAPVTTTTTDALRRVAAKEADLPVNFTIRLSSDPFIELSRLTKGTGVFSHTQPQKQKMFGDRDPNQAALIITGCIFCIIGVIIAIVGGVLSIRRRTRRQLRNPLRYSIIATSEADGGVATVVATGANTTGAGPGGVAGEEEDNSAATINSATSNNNNKGGTRNSGAGAILSGRRGSAPPGGSRDLLRQSAANSSTNIYVQFSSQGQINRNSTNSLAGSAAAFRGYGATSTASLSGNNNGNNSSARVQQANNTSFGDAAHQTDNDEDGVHAPLLTKQ